MQRTIESASRFKAVEPSLPAGRSDATDAFSCMVIGLGLVLVQEFAIITHLRWRQLAAARVYRCAPDFTR